MSMAEWSQVKKYIHKIKLMFSLTVYMLPFTLLLFNELCCASLLFVMLSQKVIKKTNPTKKKITHKVTGSGGVYL